MNLDLQLTNYRSGLKPDNRYASLMPAEAMLHPLRGRSQSGN